MKQKVILTVGASSAGKTTFAKFTTLNNRNIVNINRDDIRLQVTEKKSLLEYKFNKGVENKVTQIQQERANRELQNGNSIIISDTNLNPDKWQYWRDLAEYHGADFAVEYFPISLKDALERNAKRAEHIPEAAIRRQIETFERNFPNEINYWTPTPYVRPVGASKAIIVDIDGTLAHMTGRHPFDMTRVDEDSSDEFVIELVNNMFDCGYTVILMSGRNESARQKTGEWLKKHGVKYDFLHFRDEDDWRPDDIAKDDMFNRYGIGEYDIRFVLDDRQKVVDMWRHKGLKCLQVQPGDF